VVVPVVLVLVVVVVIVTVVVDVACNTFCADAERRMSANATTLTISKQTTSNVLCDRSLTTPSMQLACKVENTCYVRTVLTPFSRA
jgi:hypothetical protein